mgnify:CR=1 FL=1
MQVDFQKDSSNIVFCFRVCILFLQQEDKKIPSKQGEEKDEVHTLDNQQEKSSNLNYMLIGEAKENHVQNVAESAKEDIPTELIQSKIIFTESKQTTFSGFQNTSIQELVHKIYFSSCQQWHS